MKKLIRTGAFVLFALLLFSCGESKTALYETNGVIQTKDFAAPKKMAANAVMKSRASDAVVAYDDAMVMEEAAIESESASGKPSSLERKIVRNGNISLEVESLESSAEKISEWAAKFDGYVINTWESDTNANYTVKIPSDRFDEAFNETKTYGKFLNGNIYSDDITDSYYDLETRLNAKKVLRDRLQGYLVNAKETKELLNIEKELNNAVTEIERMEGRLRRMQDQVSYSTITINLQLPFRTTSEGFQWPSWTDGFRRFAGNVLDFFIVVFQIILYIIVCGIPVLAIIAFLYWLLFGRIGLVKKLFKKLK